MANNNYTMEEMVVKMLQKRCNEDTNSMIYIQ